MRRHESYSEKWDYVVNIRSEPGSLVDQRIGPFKAS